MAGEKKKVMRLSDNKEDCLTNLRFADDVLLFSTSLELLCEFKTSTEAVGLGIHPDKTKILRNPDKEKPKEFTVDNISIEVLSKGDSARYLGQKITIEVQETEEFNKQAESSVSSVPHISSRIDLKRQPIMPQTPSFRYGHHANIDLCKWNVDIITKTRKNDQDHATKDASPTVQAKRIYKSNNKKEAVGETAEDKKKYEGEEQSARVTEKLKRAQIKTLTRIKTAMCPSKKTLTR